MILSFCGPATNDRRTILLPTFILPSTSPLFLPDFPRIEAKIEEQERDNPWQCRYNRCRIN